ncbi:MAG: arginase family protein [Candidatus Microbacterium phytovorans]|uniref:Arginase family protein n=1 Tax=Candidatus Microbacterium phytovorans TaxID=3121374 RepID=A0AAJ6B473_9MICO|nr:arginase family protein [Microbacterium sp.]WEK13879.1 MAG: arginase family protein [Microbacterium sp.]
MTRFLVVPQWQGSPAARAMLLVDGADAIAGDLPRASCTRVEVPVEAGESLDTGIRRFSALRRVRESLTEALDASEEVALVVGGDCGVAAPAIAHAAARHPKLAVVWFDAHGDFHTPETSPSGAFAGMVLRAVTDGGPLGDASVPAERVVLAGAREFDEAEGAAVAAAGVHHVPADALGDPAALLAAVDTLDADALYIHVDLDVLDPAVLSGVARPFPFGLQAEELTGAIRALRERLPLAGASIAGFSPSSPHAAVDDLGTILRVVGSLA